ncbi:MAG: DUF885 domain-containing protein, partial [candidate division Zixibacteria bacterium]|nr:DUF885 domain-containing protein [candidate division Zixibacteria bacterium]
VLSSNLFAQSKADNNFQKLASEILDNLQKFYPVEASEKGVHKYDYLVTDYSRRAVKNEISKLKKFERRLYKYNKSNLTTENRIGQKLLKSNLDIALQDLSKIKWHTINPHMYVNDAVNSIYFLLISEHAPLNERAQNILARMKAIPDLFVQAQGNLKNPPPVYVEMAREMIRTGIDFFGSVKSELSNDFPELASEINNAANRIVTSLNEYDNFLANISTGDEVSFAIGKADFDYKLKHEYFYDYDTDSLLKIGEALFKESDSAYKTYTDWLEINEPIDSVFVPRSLTKQDILDYYKWEQDQVKKFIISEEILTIPNNIGECIIIETPEVFRPLIGSIAYQMPGAFNSAQTGYFYVKPIPDSLTHDDQDYYYPKIHGRLFKGSVVHEAFPGHHLQLQMTSRTVNDIRKWQDNNCLIEGWALYSEEMMYQKGLYGKKARPYLKVLGGIRFRAMRIILDVKLHTGQFSREEAVKWLTDIWGGYEEYAKKEVNGCALNPTYKMSYLIGKKEVLRLLDDYKKKEGDNFSLKQFHDTLLAEGSLPIPIIRKLWGFKN